MRNRVLLYTFTQLLKKKKEKEKSYFSFLATKAPANHLFSSELKPLIPFGQRTTQQRTLRGHGAPGHLGNGAGKGKGLPFATFCCGWTHRAAGNLLAPCCFAKLATYLGCYGFREGSGEIGAASGESNATQRVTGTELEVLESSKPQLKNMTQY